MRLMKGLSVRLYGQGSRIRDQLSLPREGATDDEVLLRQSELATQYTYSALLGLSYSFGSIYNSVVNPRFGS